MSTSVHAHIVIGVPMSGNILLVRTPKDSSKCPNGHTSKNKEPFCSKCGGKMSQSFSETFIPSFINYAKSIGEKPADLFENWREPYNPNINLDKPSFGFYGDEPIIFGIQVADTGDLMYSPAPVIISPDTFVRLEKIVCQVLQALLSDAGWPMPEMIPKVYLYGP